MGTATTTTSWRVRYGSTDCSMCCSSALTSREAVASYLAWTDRAGHTNIRVEETSVVETTTEVNPDQFRTHHEKTRATHAPG